MPYNLVRVLEDQDSSVFAEKFKADHEVPDLIWNESMRDSLQTAVRNHVGNFADVLRQNPHTTYFQDSSDGLAEVVYPQVSVS